MIELYCSHLGFSRDDLRGKMILDLGAGYCGFGRECAQERLARVVSVEPDLGILLPHWKTWSRQSPSGGSMTIAARSQALPFRDDTFDMVLAHYSVPMLLETQEAVHQTFAEICRVLKRGGEARIVPVRFGTSELTGWIAHEITALEQSAEYDIATRTLAVPEPALFGGTKTKREYPLLIIRKRSNRADYVSKKAP